MKWLSKIFVQLRRESGFSLLEIVLAIAIIGLVLEAVIAAEYHALDTSLTAQKRHQAVLLAQEGLELGRNATLPATVVEDAYPFNQYSPVVYRSVYISPFSIALMRVDAVVYWTDSIGNPQITKVTSLRNK